MKFDYPVIPQVKVVKLNFSEAYLAEIWKIADDAYDPLKRQDPEEVNRINEEVKNEMEKINLILQADGYILMNCTNKTDFMKTMRNRFADAHED